MPVLPLVASRIVIPGRSDPERSPARIICRAGRSFTEPPGFRCSAFANTETPRGNPNVRRRSWISGVPPMLVSMEVFAASCGCSEMPALIILNLDPKNISSKSKPAANFGLIRGRPLKLLLGYFMKSTVLHARKCSAGRVPNNRRNIRSNRNRSRIYSFGQLSKATIETRQSSVKVPSPLQPNRALAFGQKKTLYSRALRFLEVARPHLLSQFFN